MKTITLKADAKFDKELTTLAQRLGTTKSAVIREAVGEYRAKLDRDAMRARIQELVPRLREQTQQAIEDFDDTTADGLDDV
ncbi:MAG TPA: ribbon-helix-helix protein, CopG family [Xanthomonadales bacterium]|nr:ribbon-helix-helix protein, CopG family [Xanthomonadales bacterium]